MFNLKFSVEREKDMRLVDMNKEVSKREVTLLVMSSFLNFLGILRSCVDFRVSTEVLRFRHKKWKKVRRTSRLTFTTIE